MYILKDVMCSAFKDVTLSPMVSRLFKAYITRRKQILYDSRNEGICLNGTVKNLYFNESYCKLLEYLIRDSRVWLESIDENDLCR